MTAKIVFFFVVSLLIWGCKNEPKKAACLFSEPIALGYKLRMPKDSIKIHTAKLFLSKEIALSQESAYALQTEFELPSGTVRWYFNFETVQDSLYSIGGKAEFKNRNNSDYYFDLDYTVIQEFKKILLEKYNGEAENIEGVYRIKSCNLYITISKNEIEYCDLPKIIEKFKEETEREKKATNNAMESAKAADKKM